MMIINERNVKDKGYTLFTKQYFIGIVLGVVGLMAYQKYIKK